MGKMPHAKRLLVGSLLLPFLATLVLGLFAPAPSASAATINASWKDRNTLTAGGLDYKYAGLGTIPAEPGGGTFVAFTYFGGPCPYYIYFPNGTNLDTVKAGEYDNGSSCKTGPGFTGTINITNARPAATTTPPSGGTGAESDGAIDVNCGGVTQVLINPLNWILCPMAEAISHAAMKVDEWINDMLCINTKTIFGSGTATVCTGSTADPAKTSAAYQAAWSVFRTLALGMLAVIVLIIIISQILGLETFDAYMLRKTLPRLFIAAIGIALSWQLLSFLVEFSNVLGTEVRNIIYAPFIQSGFKTSINATDISLGGSLFAGVTGLTIWATLGAFGLASFLLTGLLAAIVAYLVLVLRNILVIMLILMAPVAIVAYILPNTQKLFKFWWEWLFKALMVFPIITGLIAIGRVFSSIAATAGSDANQLVAFIAYIMPYFLLPFTFRLAGGALGTIGGFVNDRGRGGFDRLKKFRGGQSQQNVSAMAAGNRLRNNNRLSRAFNRSTRAVATAPSAGFNPMTMRSRYTGAETQHLFNEAEELRTKNADFMSGMQDDRVVWAVLRGGRQGRKGMQTELERQGLRGAELDTVLGMAERMNSSGSMAAVQAAAAIQQASTGTGYEDAGQMLDTIAQASEGNRALGAKMLGSMRGLAVQSGRHDLGSAGFGMMANQLSQVYENGTGSADTRAIQRDAFSSADVTTLARGRGESVRNLSGAVAEYVNSDAPQADRSRYAAQLQNFVDNATEYGALARSHEAHEQGRNVVLPEAGASAAASAEYGTHRSRYAEDSPRARNNPDNPNNPQQQ